MKQLLPFGRVCEKLVLISAARTSAACIAAVLPTDNAARPCSARSIFTRRSTSLSYCAGSAVPIVVTAVVFLVVVGGFFVVVAVLVVVVTFFVVVTVVVTVVVVVFSVDIDIDSVSDVVVLLSVDDMCSSGMVVPDMSAVSLSTVAVVPLLEVVVSSVCGGICSAHAVNVSANRSVRHSSCSAFIVSPLLTGYHAC